jgi:hypothetical protein
MLFEEASLEDVSPPRERGGIGLGGCHTHQGVVLNPQEHESVRRYLKGACAQQAVAVVV